MVQYDFSIIIPTLNGIQTLPRLFRGIRKRIANYTSETIVIDSGSTDGTLEYLKRVEKDTTLRIIRIPKRDFNHGDTRNRGVRMARGKLVCFFSQDVMLKGKDMFRHFAQDLELHPKAVAVFGKNIPYPSAGFVNSLEHQCRWERIDRYTDRSGVLVQTLEKPFVPYVPGNHFIWYFFGNTASCFKRSFLLKHPFPRTGYGEDILIGKRIIELGYAKIYDTRCAIYHSHEYGLREYWDRQTESLRLRYNVMGLREKGRFMCKMKKILAARLDWKKKAAYAGELCFYYVLKLIIFVRLSLTRGNA
jgi:rhamnosyltransferase